MTVIRFPLHRTRQHPRAGWTDQPQRLRINRHGPIVPLPADKSADLAALASRVEKGRRALHRIWIATLLLMATAFAAGAAVHLPDVIARFG